MINVLYRTGTFSYPTKNENAVGGMIATFSGNREVDICTNKTLPGFFAHGYTAEPHETVFMKGMMAVLIGQMNTKQASSRKASTTSLAL